MKYYLPISIDITNEKILVLGGDTAAWKKIKILQRFGAKVNVVSRKVIDPIKKLGITYTLKNYEPSDLEGYLMVYSCLNDNHLNTLVVKDAKAKGILVNIHDKPSLCQFISPAIYQNKNMSVAVASNGHNVYNSIKLRDHLKDYLTENIQNIIDL